MKDKIVAQAKEDIPQYFDDFKTFWDKSLTEISEDDVFKIYRATLIPRNWKISFQALSLKGFDPLLNEIFEDVNSSFFLALLGLYRSAHMHMRSSVELSLQLLYFVHHPIEFARWQQGKFVLKFDKLSDYILSHPNFKKDITKQLDTIRTNWKHFSKHIHGESPLFFQCETDVRKTNTFSRKDFGIWKSNFLKNVYFLNLIFLSFFIVDLNRIPEASRNILVSFLTDDDRAELGL